jgi:hypothetical protein
MVPFYFQDSLVRLTILFGSSGSGERGSCFLIAESLYLNCQNRRLSNRAQRQSVRIPTAVVRRNHAGFQSQVAHILY